MFNISLDKLAKFEAEGIKSTLLYDEKFYVGANQKLYVLNPSEFIYTF